MTTARVTPGLVFHHLERMTDGTGLFEHALHAQPRPEHGYCLDDAARALVVTCREPGPGPTLKLLTHRYLSFTLSAVRGDGRCHNRMSTDGSWSDTPGLGDWWGRALWGLGVASVHAPSVGMRAQALLGFRAACQQRSPHVRAMAFAALGAGEVLLSRPDESCARELLIDAVAAIGANGLDQAWPWPQTRLTYANAAIIEALLLAGLTLPDAAIGRQGLALMDFLLDLETRDGHLSVTGVGGRSAGSREASFDQQPIEVAALAGACARAYDITADERWRDGVALAWGWFLGDNDSATPMFDASTGAGYDGLERLGRNLNQGAESTLAALSTAQLAQRLAVFE